MTEADFIRFFGSTPIFIILAVLTVWVVASAKPEDLRRSSKR